MALQKTKATGYGINGNYWRILQLNCNYDRLDAVCVVGLYIDAASRQAGSNPISQVQFDLASQFHNNRPTDEDIMKNISLKESYKALKALAVIEAGKAEEERNGDLAFFSDAIDV